MSSLTLSFRSLRVVGPGYGLDAGAAVSMTASQWGSANLEICGLASSLTAAHLGVGVTGSAA